MIRIPRRQAVAIGACLAGFNYAAQAAELIPDAYLADKYVAPESAPSRIVIAGKDEPGERMVVSGRVTDGQGPLAGVSVFAFHTDAKGRYTPGEGRNDDENARLHGAMRTDKDGRYKFASIRPAAYGTANPQHLHFIVRMPGYKPRMYELWFEGAPAYEERRTIGMDVIPSYHRPGAVEIRPISRDADGVWHATRDFVLERE